MITHDVLGLMILSVLAKGKHGIVYNGLYKRKKCVIKTALPNSPSPNCIIIESKFLFELNKHKIGPRLFYANKELIAMQKIEGERISDIDLHKNNFVIFAVLRQCFLMDKLGISKDEMVNPYKHVIVLGKKDTDGHIKGKRKIVMIDFERCSYSKKPKNVTQFCEYLRRRGFSVDRQLLIEYRKEVSLKNFRRIIKMFK